MLPTDHILRTGLEVRHWDEPKHRNPIFADNSSINGRSCSAPRAQLSPMLRRGKCETETINASRVWPVSVLPLASVIVPDTITGSLHPFFLKNRINCKKCSLTVKNIKNCFNKKNMNTPVDQSPCLFRICFNKLIESDCPGTRVIYIRRH